jgi:hypothetical protein
MGGELHGGSEIARRLRDPETAMAHGTAPVIPGSGATTTLAAAVPTRGPRPAGALAAVIAALLLSCGCTPGRAVRPGTPGPGTLGSTRAPASPASPAQAAARAALAAYTGMWQQMQAAGVTADWKDPRLAAYASGPALSTLVTGLRNARDQGIVIKGTIVTHPRVVSVTPSASPDRVLVSDCLDDTHWLDYVAATGRLQNNVPGGHHLTQAAVTVRAGRWTVSQLAVQGPGTC